MTSSKFLIFLRGLNDFCHREFDYGFAKPYNFPMVGTLEFAERQDFLGGAYCWPDSPMWFGPDGKPPQCTYIVEEPLEVSQADFLQLADIALKVADYIDSYSLNNQAPLLGADPHYLEDCLTLDGAQANKLLYGGLDIYFDPEHGPKILEINARVQAMGLQDTRQEHLGIVGQPKMVDHFIDLLQGLNSQKVLVLGSKTNPFWRSHARMAYLINQAGFDCTHRGTEDLDTCRDFRPDVIIKLASSSHILYSEQARRLRELVTENKTPFINSLSSTFYGDRGFLHQIAQDLPRLFPRQTELSTGADEEEIKVYPWLKLETGNEFVAVVNFNEVRRWYKDALRSLICRDMDGFEKAVAGKTNGDVLKLRQAKNTIAILPPEQVKWIAQENLNPLTARLRYQGELTSLNILHRVYWVKDGEGKVRVSLEGFGCSADQFSASKGKINAGSGIAIPMVIV